MPRLWGCLAIAVSVAAAFAFRLALGRAGGQRWAAWLLASLVVAASPCLVPLTHLPGRFGTTLVAIAILVKLFDLAMHPGPGQKLTFMAFALYLANGFWLVLRKRPPDVPPAVDRKHFLRTTPAALIAIAACAALFWRDWSDVPFAIEHCAKVASVVLATVFSANCAAQAWRLLGGTALTPMHAPQAAPTPADFWRRWNRPAQQFLHEYVFPLGGGIRRPVRGTLTVFAVSGLLHEYVFGIASGSVQGWQLLFFASHGIVAVATRRIRPRGWAVIPCIAATIAVNLALAILFFKSVDSVVPFYSPRAAGR